MGNQPKTQLLLNRFEISNLLRSSETSHVYLAFDRISNKKVIVKQAKCTDNQSKEDQIKINRLIVEANILKMINNPAIVKYVHSWGNKKEFFLVTEYINSRSIKDEYENNPASREDIIEYTIQLLEITEYLHSMNIIHRDVKPSNILLGDTLTLIDFNAAEIKNTAAAIQKVIIGTPGYQCPESFNGEITEGCDIFAIGGTLLFLLTGKNPTGNITSFQNSTPHRDLLEIAFKALNSDRNERFASAFEMKKSLLTASDLQVKLIWGKKSRIISKNRFVIGRSSTADFQIIDSNKFVSPMHAEISKEGDQFYILDRSINGTYIYRKGRYVKVEKEHLFDGEIIVLCYKPEKGPYISLKFRNTQI